MRSPLLLAAVLTSTSFLSAQASGNYTNYPDDMLISSSYTSRGAIAATSNGEVLNEMPAGMVAGVGMDGTGNCFLHGICLIVQDQDCSTAENLGIVARPRDAAGTGPDPVRTIYSGGGLLTPVVGSGLGVWVFTIAFQVPQQVPCDTYFYGISLQAAPNWSGDGLGVHMAHYNSGTLGDHPRSGTLGYGHSIDSVSGAITRHDCDWAIELRTSSPTLQFGANDPSNVRTAIAARQGTTAFGIGGMFPDVGGVPRRDGIDLRIVDANNPNAPTAVLIAFGLAPVPFNFPGVVGNVLLDPGTLLVFRGGTTSATPPARAIFPFLPANSIPVTLAGTGARMFAQGVVVDPAVGMKLTNAQALQL